MPSLKDILEFIKVEHSLFALPFIFLGVVLASATHPDTFHWTDIPLVIGAAVGARTAAMVLNRIIDRKIDAANPRTEQRHLVTGKITPTVAWSLVAACSTLLFVCAGLLNPLCLYLSPILLTLFTLYPYMKRFTWACHLFLGITLGVSPVGGWLAVTAEFESGTNFWIPFSLFIGVATWVAGFDIIYSLLDVEHDKQEGIHSIAADFGEKPALIISSILHVATVACFGWMGWLMELNFVYWIVLVLTAGLLTWEHLSIKSREMAKIQKAFFTANVWVAVMILTGASIALLIG